MGFQLTSTPRSGVSNKNILLAANLLLERSVGQHLDRARRGLLGLGLDASLAIDESGQALKIAAALVVLRGRALAIEPLEGREALHAPFPAELLVGVGVDFGDGDFVGLGLKGGCQLFVDGREGLAVAAPGREELDEGGLAGVEDDVVEVVGEEVLDGGCGRGAGDGEGRGDELRDADHSCCVLLLLMVLLVKTIEEWGGCFNNVETT